MFIKIGESIEIKNIEETSSCVPMVSQECLDNFKKTAANLKKIAPKAEDFLYFSAVMMHAAEAASLNDDGTPRLTSSGEAVKVGWNKDNGTWRWTSNDKSIKPYKNSNGDIFPEEELVKAYKKWVGKPLCIDHKSSSVDHVRGFIVDTYYDRSLKRVIALCALDKQNYPDLARKVATGYSHSVSMGTAVGRAICSDCAQVARTEADFCDHMRKKSGYGEINIELNPIELSIVVNGADPKAHIKHIIAAANSLNAYVDSKAEELKKLADNYHATITFTKGNASSIEDSKAITDITVTSKDLETFKKDVDKAIADFAQLQSSLNGDEENNKESGNDSASNQSSGSSAMAEGTTVSSDLGLAPPSTDKYASADADALTELRAVASAIEVKLSQMKASLDKLANINTSHKQEENMSGPKDNINKKAYYQGTEEPKPGQVQYAKEPLNEKLRDGEDKQMVGQMDTGPVDGMHPGPDSVGMSELERKKMLARATSEERAMRRNAIVNLAKEALENKKVAYFQNGEGPTNPNTPTPGKPKYPVDKLNEQLRDEDKHMVGQKPFPGVGPVDGLHPSPSSADTSDELKRKELLRRASSLRAAFDKTSASLGDRAWNVFLGDKLILTASVNDLTNGNADLFYDKIATTEFGSRLLQKIKVQGADKVRAMVKKAQDAGPAAPPADLAAPAPGGDAPPAGGSEPPVEDAGKSGDPKENVKSLAKQLVETSSDMQEAVNLLVGEQAEMGAEPAPGAAPEMGASASFGLSTLNTLRRELNGALTHAMKEAIAEINDHKEELDMISGMYDDGAINPSNHDVVNSITEDAVGEAKAAVADGFKLMTAFVKYARGTKAIVKRAEIEAELKSLAQQESTETSMGADDNNLMDLVNDTNADIDDLASLLGEDGEETHHSHEGDELEGVDHVELPELGLADDNEVNVEVPKGAPVPAGLHEGDTVKVTAATKEGRAALRAKLAAEALKTSPHLNEAHPKGGVTTQLDVKPTGDLARVEDLEETHDAMMDLANAPPKVRKEAEAIRALISEGKIAASDLDALVSEGLDKDAVSYYKKYFGDVDGGSEFASELVKEHVKAQVEAELQGFRIKMARAYELAYDMVDRGLCHNDRGSVSAQVDEIMKFNDESFDSLKKVVARHAPVMRKEAGRMPQVGVIGSGEVGTSAQSDGSLYDQLSAAFAKTSKKLF